MRPWLIILGGLLIWAAHFFAIYIVASLFPGIAIARWLVAVLGFVALGALLLLIRSIRRRTRTTRSDEIGHWLESLAFMGVALASAAIIYQSLPALIA